MLRLIWRQLRGRAGRSVALLVGVLVATTGFVVLTGATTTSRLDVIGTVERDTKAAYDILVRPKGTRTPLEAERGLVRPNYLSGHFGGITTEQYEQVKAVAGIDVAAPIAMLGYSTTPVPAPLDLTNAVDRSLDRQVIRVDPTFVAERGLSSAAGKPRYVYVTKHPLIYPRLDAPFDMEAIPYSDGRSYPSTVSCGPVPREVLPDGRSLPICDPRFALLGSPSTYSERAEWTVDAVRLLPDGRFESMPFVLVTGPGGSPTTADRLRMAYDLTVPFLLAAVDPAAEDRLVGLDGAVIAGRAIGPGDTAGVKRLGTSGNVTVPVLVTSRPFIDAALSARFTRLPGVSPAGVSVVDLERQLGSATGTAAGSDRHDVSAGYRAKLAEGLSETGCCYGQLQVIVQSGDVQYERRPDGTLHASPQPPAAPTVYGDQTTSSLLPRPWLSEDQATRAVRRLPLPDGGNAAQRYWRAVGVFDPDKLTTFSDLGQVPLKTYQAPAAQGADDESRTALGGQPLEPSGNPAGYLSAPPLLLTNLDSLPKLLAGGTGPQIAAPISAIRVRVAGVSGYSERSAEHVRLVAEQIAARTGLDVDITLGSSPAPQTVELPAGSFGRPALRLTEHWSALGVASIITQAVDRKSVLLFFLVLVVCALFLGNAVSAAVRDRRPELAVLACLGWPVRRIGALILGEVAVLGLAAGVLSLALAVPVGMALGIDVDWRRAMLAVPVALLLALAAGAVPALRAARAHPGGALRPVVAGVRWVRRPRTLVGLAVTNLLRTPGRTLLGVGALAIGVAALTLVAAATYAFRGTIVGSLLGDVVSLRVRDADMAAAAATVLLGAAAVADVLYLNIRDRAAELATLRAVGWTDAALARLVGYEGLALGVTGAVTGAAVGLGGAACMIGALPAELVLVAALVAMAGVLVTTVAALVPTILLRRLRTARLLAEE
ncbi:FtsX-like permease family protein [Micromonospora avicenniae]|uniref:FtsX-like permease family protein n=1 Tax=Micromonospora avicenniae TaxID=1198245 RepID=UPI003328E1E0